MFAGSGPLPVPGRFVAEAIVSIDQLISIENSVCVFRGLLGVRVSMWVVAAGGRMESLEHVGRRISKGKVAHCRFSTPRPEGRGIAEGVRRCEVG